MNKCGSLNTNQAPEEELLLVMAHLNGTNSWKVMVENNFQLSCPVVERLVGCQFDPCSRHTKD